MPPLTLRDIPPALEFYPTAQEFQDPLRYIRSIRPQASKTGICKIIPPPSWQPPRVISEDTLTFRVRTQALHMLRDRGGGGRVTLDSIKSAVEDYKGHLNFAWPPVVRTKQGFLREVDIGRLWRVVAGVGGVKAVERGRLWGWVCKKLGLDVECDDGARIEKEIRKVYGHYVDVWRRKVEGSSYMDGFLVEDSDDDEGVHVSKANAVDEERYGGSESESQWDYRGDVETTAEQLEEWKKSHVERMIKVRTFLHNQKRNKTRKGSDSDWVPEDDDSGDSDYCPGASSGKRKTRQSAKYSLRRRGDADEDSDDDDVIIVPDGEPEMRTSPTKKGRSTPSRPWRKVRAPSRRIAWDSSSEGSEAQHDVSVTRQKTPKARNKSNTVIKTLQICKQCGHIKVNKNGKTVCISKKCCEEFIEGRTYLLKDFRRMGIEFRRDWFRSRRYEVCPNPTPSIQEVEEEYWKVVDEGQEAVWVQYGADLDSRKIGSGFPTIGDMQHLVPQERFDEYVNHPWNITKLPNMRGSLLGCLPGTVTGVNCPWLYIGMLFSTFCYHVEDSNMFSINYMHFTDEPESERCQGKVWYGCPGGDNARLFENAIKEQLGELFNAHPDILFDITTMMSPVHLMGKCEMYRLVQKPGEFVITFPQAYHCGFSLGYNVAEAVNFLTAEALVHCRAAAVRYRRFKRRAAITPEEIVFLNSKHPHLDHLDGEDAGIMYTMHSKMLENEKKLRKTFFYLAAALEIPVAEGVLDMSAESFESCTHCNQPCVWSAVMQIVGVHHNSHLLCTVCSASMMYEECQQIKKSNGRVTSKPVREMVLRTVPTETLELACQRYYNQSTLIRTSAFPDQAEAEENHTPTDIRLV